MSCKSKPPGSSVQLVVFHVDSGKDVVDKTKYGQFRTKDYHRMIARMWASFRRHHPGATLTILTDMKTRFGSGLSGASVLRRQIDVTRLMYERMIFQRECLSQLDSGQPVFLLDSDMLCLNSFSHLFAHNAPSFDLGLTFRKSHNTPINGGLLIVNRGADARKNALHLMDQMIRIYEMMVDEKKTWYGDQFALRDLVGLHHSKMRNMSVVEKDVGRILILDCGQYNFTPQLNSGKPFPMENNCHLFHFKGALKHYMEPFYWIERSRAKGVQALYTRCFAFFAKLKIERLERIRRASMSSQQELLTNETTDAPTFTAPGEKSDEQKLISPKTLATELRSRNLTYCGYDKLSILYDCIANVERHNLQGRFIEAGVALGGSAIFTAHYKSKERVLELYDIYNQIPAPGPEDGEDAHRRYLEIASGQSKGLGSDKYYGYLGDIEGVVANNLSSFGFSIKENNISLIKGLFEDTMRIDGPVALAHIDGDWYDSVQVCIERIAPHIVPGGYMVFDDYSSYSGCRKAVDQWLAASADFKLVAQKRSAAVQRLPLSRN